MTTDAQLQEQVSEFANEIDMLMAGVFGASSPDIKAELKPEKDPKSPRHTFLIGFESSAGDAYFPLKIEGKKAALLTLLMECTWDRHQHYIAVRRSEIHLLDVKSVPLMRFEFVDAMVDPTVPTAHIHVHAHRDELLFLGLQAGNGKPRTRHDAAVAGKRKFMLADLHIPVGGTRFRPSLEDVLQMLISEFRFDHEQSTAQAALDEGRTKWRRRQLGAAIRDDPFWAAKELANLGFTVTPPASVPPATPDKLSRY